MLVHYGFIGSHTPDISSVDDGIRLDHLIVPTLEADVRGQLQDVGFLGGYALLPMTSELCFKTQVAVRAALLSCNEWEYFAANGEDLSVDHTAAVKTYVCWLLAEYRKDATEKLQDVEASGSGVAQTILKQRWTQIVDAIDAFARA